MLGKRILDLAALLRATGGVAARHVALRQRQVKLYGKTSSLWKAVEGQTGTIAQIYQNASVTVRNTSASSPTYATQARGPAQTSIPSKYSVAEEPSIPEHQKFSDQESFNEASQVNSTSDPVPSQAVNVQQEAARSNPLPDGTVPPLDKDSIVSYKSSDEEISGGDTARKAQRQAEFQIPVFEAEPPQSAATGDNEDATHPNLEIQQDRDTYYEPPLGATPVLSSLPRMKLPRNLGTVQESDEHVPDKGIDQDVFYSSQPKLGSRTIPSNQAVPQQNASEEIFSELFHSPKVAKMLKGKSGGEYKKNGLALQNPREAIPEQRKEARMADKVSFSSRDGSEIASPKSTDEDIAQLAKDIQGDITPAQRESKVALFPIFG